MSELLYQSLNRKFTSNDIIAVKFNPVASHDGKSDNSLRFIYQTVVV
jgi:hypothetical protein